MKTFLSGLILLMAFGVIQNAQASEGYESYGASYSYGVYRFTVKNCLQDVYVNSTKYEIHAVVADDFDYSDPQNAVFQVYTAGGFEEVSIPTDFSVQGQEVKVKKTATGDIYTWKVYLRKAIKASLPFSRNFTSVSPVSGYDPTDATSIGWAYRVVSVGVTPSAPILGGKDQAMFFAYATPASEFSALFYASNNNTQVNIKASIDASEDGFIWTTLKSYNNDVPANNATNEEKTVTLALDESYRYIRLIMTDNKGGGTDPNITLNKFSITEAKGTSISTNVQSEAKIYVLNNKIVFSDLEVVSAQVLNLSGQAVGQLSSSEIDIAGLNKGTYIVVATLNSGKNIYKKIIL